MSPPDSSGGGACHHNRPRPTTAENAAAAKPQVRTAEGTPRVGRARARRALLRLEDRAWARGDAEVAALACWLRDTP